MNKLILSAAVLAAFAAPAFADDAAPASPFTGNMTLASNYIFRGLTQTFAAPAIQGGFDYVNPNGFYIGNWDSNVSGNQYNNGAGLEMDLYTGYRFTPVKDLLLDVGAYYYYYPNATIGTTAPGSTPTNQKYDNGEVYLAGTYKWFTAKYNYGVTNFFGLNSNTASTAYSGGLAGNGNSRGSGYLDLSGNFNIADKTTLTVHVGHQTVNNYGALDYTDYKVGVAKDFGFATVGFAVTTTDANKNYYTAVNGAGTSSKNIGGTAAVLSISKTF